MQTIFKIANIIYSTYFFLFANFYFWMSVGGLLAKKNLSSINILQVDLVLGLISFPISVLFFKRTSNRFIFGLAYIFSSWLINQAYRLVFIINFRISSEELGNLFFFGVPFIVLLTGFYLEKKLIKTEIKPDIVES